MSFFDKSKVDADKVSEIVGSLEDLSSNAESYRDEIDSYKDELDSIRHDLDDAETQDDINAIVSALRCVSVPNGYEDSDGSPEDIADELEGVEMNRSEYEDWQEKMQERINSATAALMGVARGSILPSQRQHPYSIKSERTSSCRTVRPGQEPDAKTSLPYSGETDAWRRAIAALASRAAGAFHGDSVDAVDAAAKTSERLTQSLIDLAADFMAFKTADGNVCRPTERPMLAVMWLVDDLLQTVNSAMGNSSRIIVTSGVSMEDMLRRLEVIQQDFGSGCEQIDGSIKQDR